jgi:hypothetical protein
MVRAGIGRAGIGDGSWRRRILVAHAKHGDQARLRPARLRLGTALRPGTAHAKALRDVQEAQGAELA